KFAFFTDAWVTKNMRCCRHESVPYSIILISGQTACDNFIFTKASGWLNYRLNPIYEQRPNIHLVY
ncbi:hypothetical protein, partial [Vibrio splendidus]|uniref:hypothetical protein n=1 Tax=Vibrio splendidus TaxID=29497 RepID=UPI001A7E1771